MIDDPRVREEIQSLKDLVTKLEDRIKKLEDQFKQVRIQNYDKFPKHTDYIRP